MHSENLSVRAQGGLKVMTRTLENGDSGKEKIFMSLKPHHTEFGRRVRHGHENK